MPSGYEGAEASYLAAEPRGLWLNTTDVFYGIPFATHYASVLFDLRTWPVPVGSGLTAAKLEFRGGVSQGPAGDPFPGTVRAILPTSNGQDSIEPETVSQIQAANYCVSVDTAPFGNLSANNNHGVTPTDWMRLYLDRRNGFLRVGQIRTLDTTGIPFWTLWRIRRSVADIGAGSLSVRLTLATGSPGNYRKGAAFSTGTILYTALSTSDSVELSAHAGTPEQPAGTVLMMDISTSSASGADPDAYIEIGIDHTDPVGVTDNMLCEGDAGELQGFFERINFYSGKQIHEAPDEGTEATLTVNAPWIEDQLYVWGSPKFSPDVELDLVPLITAAFDHSTWNGYLALRFGHSAAVADYITWHSMRSLVATVGSPPFYGADFGLQLTLEYETDQVRNLGMSVEPAVESFGLSVEPAVEHQGTEISAAVKNVGIEVEVAVTNQGVELTPAVETAGSMTVGDEE